MKSLNYLLLTLLPIMFFVGISNSQTNWVLKSTGCNLNSVHFHNDMIGWAVGDSGTIIGTLDGGANWLCATSGTTNKLNSVYFINSLTGWAAGNGGVVLKTTNGGLNWTTLSSGTTSNINTIYFPTSDTGYYSGNFPLGTSKTTNGGTSWTILGIPYGSGIYFSSGKVGLVTENSSFLSKTSNGGASWSANTAPGNPENQNAISFINASTGWTTGKSNRAYKTTNGGTNWTIQTNSASVFATFYGVDFIDDMKGFIAGYSGFFNGDSAMVYATTNGGSNWVAQTTGIKKTLKDVDFVNASTGWIVGDQGLILKTTNAGASYSKQLIQYDPLFLPTYSLNDVCFVNEITGYSVGYGGYVNKTTDGGESWTTITSASFNWLFSVYFPSGNDTGWVCGRLGTIEKTENGGLNWTTLYTGTSQHLNDIVVDKFGYSSSSYGWCVGTYGTILSAGLVFVPQYSGTTNDLNSISVIDVNKAFIAGNAGTILKTTNAGLNWDAKTSGTTEDLKSICFINGSTGYVCGSSGVIRVTYDGGSSWSPQSSGTTETLNSIDFEETNYDNGYAVGENGVALYTDNGGMTWTRQATGSSTGINSVFVKELPAVSSTTSLLIKLVGRVSKYASRTGSSALPVELASFNFSLSDNDVNLQWKTVSEINNSGFDVQRSINNQWVSIGFVNGSGTTSEPQSYIFDDNDLSHGVYSYRLKQIDYNGNFQYYNLSQEVIIGAPDKIELKQNYPNPFNPSTKIIFRISQSGQAVLKVFDISGKEVKTILDKQVEAGYYSYEFNGSDLSSGIYFYTLYFKGNTITRKMTLIK